MTFLTWKYSVKNYFYTPKFLKINKSLLFVCSKFNYKTSLTISNKPTCLGTLRNRWRHRRRGWLPPGSSGRTWPGRCSSGSIWKIWRVGRWRRSWPTRTGWTRPRKLPGNPAARYRISSISRTCCLKLCTLLVFY